MYESPADAKELTVGQLAARSGVSVSALHFYERRGLISSRRTAGNQRRYRRHMLRRVAFIRVAQRVGIPLRVVANALAVLPERRTPTREDWAGLSTGWRAELDTRIHQLIRLRDDLSDCIGCGCLSLDRCVLHNRDDHLGGQGAGPQRLLVRPSAKTADAESIRVYGYALCATGIADQTTQHEVLISLGVPENQIHLDPRGTRGPSTPPVLVRLIAACRNGDTLVVPALARLARSLPEAKQICDTLAARGVRLSVGGTLHDPADPIGKAFFDALTTCFGFQAEARKIRTREGTAIAKVRGKLRGRRPKLSADQQADLKQMHATGRYTIVDLAEFFAVSRATVHRALHRHETPPTAPGPGT